MSAKRLVICGGGIAGLTAALCAHKAGWRPIVVERASELSEVGAGLQVGANAMKVLAALGLDDAVEAAGHAPNSLDFAIGETGETVFSVPAGEAARERWGAAHINIRRAALQAILQAALADQVPDALVLGQSGIDYDVAADGVTLQCESGARYAGDALIIADGVNSALRTRFFGDERADYTGHTALRALVPATTRLRSLVPDASTAWTGQERHAVTYFLRDHEWVNFVGVVEQDEPTPEGWHNQASLAQARAAFSAFAAPVRAVLERAESVRAWGLYDRPPPQHLARGKLAVIGDAGVSMPPFMAQGASFAMECAWTAVWSIASTGQFEAYSKAMTIRGGRILEAARRNGDLFHGRGLPALLGYAPIKLAARVLPLAIKGRFDWIYGFDATAGRPLNA
ncbi:MAG: FAD-dependent monooxygenase [Pseudomonadota bacterium]